MTDSQQMGALPYSNKACRGSTVQHPTVAIRSTMPFKDLSSFTYPAGQVLKLCNDKA